MTLTADEKRALAFIALLIFVSAALRLAAEPEPMALPENGGFEIAAHVEATRTATAREERAATPLGEGERVDPNTAPVTELRRLPGVGPSLAERIVSDREANGPFATAADLGRVPGVGPATLARLAPHVALPERPAAGGGARAPLDLNRADAAALAELPGLGPALAARVVAYRDSVGGFAAVDDLARVRGIGPATVARFRDRVGVRR